MKFCFINPPWLFPGELEFLSHNNGLGYLMAFLEANGHESQFIDAVLEGIDERVEVTSKYQTVYRCGLSYEAIADRIDSNAECVGITGPFTDSAMVIRELVAVIKQKHPEKRIVLGGVLPSTLPDWGLESGADLVVRGEGELAVLGLARRDDVKEIPGVLYREAGRVVATGAGERIENLDHIPFPSYTARPVDAYFSWSPRGERRRRTASMVTSRGCPFDCSFCSVHPVYGRSWRPRSAENVLEEIEYVLETHNVRHLEFEDDNFTMRPARAAIILDGIKKINAKRNPRDKLTWSAPNGVRIDTLDEDLIVKMKESSCTALCIGLESGDPYILGRMKKKLRLELVEGTVKLLAKHQLNCNAFVIIGYPGETEERFHNSVNYALKLRGLGLSSVSVLVATPYPGTDLFYECREKGYLRYPDVENVLFTAQYSAYKPEFVQIETPDFSAEEIMRRYRYFQDKVGADGVRYNVY